LSQLLEAGFEGRPLRDHVMTMLIAGHETTGTTLSFLWAHVARRRDVQESLYQEARSVGNTCGDLERLPYTEAVWKEILRLYPAVPILDRMAVEETQLGEYRIPAGANILWSPYILQRSAKYWPHRHDPKEFEPSAFLSDPPPLPGTYIPFGVGPRMCMGKALADMEALTIVSMFTRAFEIKSMETGDVRMRTLVTLRPEGGVPVKLTCRPPSSVPAGESTGECGCDLPAAAQAPAVASAILSLPPAGSGCPMAAAAPPVAPSGCPMHRNV
jgi:enediyne biosynthesis protein E7